MKKLENAKKNIEAAYLGSMLNQDSQSYGSVYEKDKLNGYEKGILEHGEDGTMQRDVWSQIAYMTKQEFEQQKNEGWVC